MGVTSALAPLARHVRALGWATLVANVTLVVTGGAVRLTGSGLGCPTWPRCTAESFTPRGALDVNAAIEFGNRMLTFVLVAVAVATLASAWATGRRDLRLLALVLGLGIPAQALIGGLTVLTGLNPWVVSFHLLTSLAIIGLTVVFLHRVDEPRPVPRRGPVVLLSRLTFAAAWVVLYLGTVVTGSGPYAGDAAAARNGVSPLTTSQLHADAVFLLLGLTIGLVVALRAVGADDRARRAARLLLAVELAQGAVGAVQYATGLPVLLVGLHLLGAALVSAAVAWVAVTVQFPAGSAAESAWEPAVSRAAGRGRPRRTAGRGRGSRSGRAASAQSR